MQTHQLSYIEFRDLRIEVAKRLNLPTQNPLRNLPGGTDGEYRDFWHKFIDVFGECIFNPCFIPINFEETLNEIKHPSRGSCKAESWELEIWEEILKVVGPGCHWIHIEW